MFEWIKRLFGKMDALEFHKTCNPKVLLSLHNAGSVMTKPHNIEHFFYCYSSEACDLLTRYGKHFGYEPSTDFVPDGEGGPCFSVVLAKPTIPDLETMDKEVEFMIAFTEELPVEYDGWGCEVVDETEDSEIEKEK